MSPIEAQEPDAREALLAGVCTDPRVALGPLGAAAGRTWGLRVFLPPARRVEVRSGTADSSEPWEDLDRVHAEGIFEGAPSIRVGDPYRLRVHWESGDASELEDPYRYPPTLTNEALAAFLNGTETRLADLLGARARVRDGVHGTRFAVWAPRALAVNLMGSFNGWEARRNPMWPVGDTGVWELFLPGVGPGALYKFEIRARPEDGTDARADAEGPRDSPLPVEKADPLGFEMELRPRSASVVGSGDGYDWLDEAWMETRADAVAPGEPISIYEVHLGSWRRDEQGEWLSYRELAATLLPYVKDLGFTHVELLPVTEHPHDASWGYQTVGYYASTSRYGSPVDLRAFVDEAHRLGLGVLLDWAPAHFPLDAHGLARFDGQPLYEHPDPRRGYHPDWGTAIFDYGRPEVVSFLISSARFWSDEFHIDGFRVDAVASMVYRDYSRGEGEWEPNEEGGRENLEAVAFLRQLTNTLHAACPGVLLCAEESTAWPGVTSPVDDGGLGFDLKWNMGWMNDSLAVFQTAADHRSALHERLTFSLHYAHAERYLLPLSHDEVVHLKRSLLSKMPGPPQEQFANLRLLLGYMWTHPGAKLLFMGGELGQLTEWDENVELAWPLLSQAPHRGLAAWVRALNLLYRSRPPLHSLDHSTEGFDWIDVHDHERSVLAYLRWGPGFDDFVAVLANFSAETWRGYSAALPVAGPYDILLDSDSPEFGGAGATRIYGPATEAPLHGRPATLTVDLPPLTIVLLARADPDPRTETEPADQPAII
ncbi:MAG: 1,4-alpha-glucan branching protein GlgB [Gemmatimonadota bacterium]